MASSKGINWTHLGSPPDAARALRDSAYGEGCVGAWVFYRGWQRGLTAFDLSPFGINGVLTNFPLPSPWQSSGLVFGGTDDYVELGEPPQLDAIANGTIALRMRPDGVATVPRVFGKDATGLNGDIVIFLEAGNQKVGFNMEPGGGANTVLSDVGVTLGVWIHVVVIWGVGGMRMYVNGAKQADTDVYAGSYTSPGNSWRIGDRNGTPLAFDGAIESVLMWNRQLPESQVTRLAADSLTPFRWKRRSYFYGDVIAAGASAFFYHRYVLSRRVA